ncbi:MAG: tetratricopeptide repeat protein [Patescibacteria group bacterium]
MFGNDIKKLISAKIFIGAEYYFNGGKYNLNKAEKLYKISLKINSDIPIAHYQLGRIYFLGGKFDLAIAEFDKELKNNQESKHPYYMRGLTNGYAGNYDEAISDLQKYIAWNPKTWAGYNDLVWVYLLKKDYQKAEESSRKGLENSSNNPWLLSNLGTALLNQEKYQEAKEKLTLAKDFGEKLTAQDWSKTYPGNDPRIAESGLRDMKAAIQLNIAIASKRMNRKEEAKKEYEEYLAMLPEDDNRRVSVDYFLLMP